MLRLLMDPLESRLCLSAGYSVIDLTAMGLVSDDALDLNDAGHIRGTTYLWGERHTFFWSKEEGMIDLGPSDTAPPPRFPDDPANPFEVEITRDSPVGMRNFPATFRTVLDGQIVHDYGSIPIAGATDRAAILEADVNASGVVVGTAATSPHLRTKLPFIAKDGKVLDLNTVVSGCDWRLRSARAINTSGQILVEAFTDDGFKRDFLLSPAADGTSATPCPAVPAAITEDEAHDDDEELGEPAEAGDDEDASGSAIRPGDEEMDAADDDAFAGDDDIHEPGAIAFVDDDDLGASLDPSDDDAVWDDEDELDWEPQDLLV